MSPPYGFTWIEKPLVAGLARPDSIEDLVWLRTQGIELLISLTEDPLRRDWINEAGLMAIHEPVEDMTAPTQGQLDRCVTAMERALRSKLGVAVHCQAGKGRTGTLLASWLVETGLSAQNAIGRIRRIRPGSIETDDQADAVVEFARRRGRLMSDG